MSKFRILIAAVVAVMMTACIGKTEATVDVTVVKNGQPQKGVQVYRFNDNGLGEGTSLYKNNCKDVKTTNDKGTVRFELKSPEDLEPSNFGVVETKNFFFATFDNDDKRNGFVAVKVTNGDKKQVTLELEEPQSGGDKD